MSLVIKTSDLPEASGDPLSASTPTGSGRIKAPPVCLDSSLKETAMTTQELSKLTFAAESSIPTTTALCTGTRMVSSDHTASVTVSSSSSTCTRESDTSGAFSDVEIMYRHEGSSNTNNNPNGTTTGQPSTPVPLLRAVSDRMNATVSLRKTSRQGRATQRWVSSSDSLEAIRLTTGCVPILQGGKILFVSSSRKPEWILPKGGWEQDETMEESAVRECFEEAGVLGALGPKLREIQYETRKAKKRRLQMEQQESKKTKQEPSEGGQDQAPAEQDKSSDSKPAPATSVVSDEAISRIRAQSEKASSKSGEETSSVTSGASATYNQVRMTLFPLYVSSVADDWPEKGRFRKAVDIDEAIKMVESRPEFQKAIIDVKQRGLHLLSDPRTAR